MLQEAEFVGAFSLNKRSNGQGIKLKHQSEQITLLAKFKSRDEAGPTRRIAFIVAAMALKITLEGIANAVKKH
uniref:Uncharacterized protein n=1 Tax=Globodera rostochiensis TaxID=31243 RepID=A0A914HI16_GLORO